MARTGISKEQVFEVATALADEGTKPSVKEVRERLGSGSFSTISSFLAEWRDEHTAQATAQVPDMPERVQSAFTQVWATAAKAAQEGVETQKQALDAMQREIRQEQADMATEIERLEQALETAAQAQAAQAKEQESQQRIANEQREQIAELSITNARLEEQCKAAVKRGDEFKQQFESLQADLSAALKALDKDTAAKPGKSKPE